MKFTTEERANRELQLNIEVEPAELEQAMRVAARKLAAKVTMPGFRRGKAPYNIVLTYFGREAVIEEALEPLTEEMYRKALHEADVHPIGPARVEHVTMDPVVLRMVVPLMPSIDPGEYHEFRLPYKGPVVTDEMVDRQLEYMRDQQAVIEPAARPAQLGDQVHLSVTGREGETEVFAQKDFDLTLGDAIIFPARGFAQYVVGMSAGEQKTVEVDYPEDYEEEELRGKHLALDIQLSEVKSVTLPELNDEFAKSAGDYENLLDLRVDMRARLYRALDREAETDYANEVIAALAAGARIEYPPMLLEAELDDMIKDLESRVQREMHLGFEDFLKTRNQTRDELRAEMRPRAERRLRQGLLIGEIARLEGMEASDAEVQDEVDTLLQEFGEHAETARKVFEQPANKEMIEHDIVSRKVVARLIGIARGEAGAAPSTEAPAAEAPAPEAPAEPASVEAAVEPPVTDVVPETPAEAPPGDAGGEVTTESIG